MVARKTSKASSPARPVDPNFQRVVQQWKTAAASVHREAFCRHQMIADIYAHGRRVDMDVQVLSHDIDVDGVDLTLIRDGAVVPLQLKSRVESKTAEWDVRRRVPFPKNYSRLSEAILAADGAATEGLGGALVVQELVPLPHEPYVRLWYRVANLSLIYVRKPARCARLVETAATGVEGEDGRVRLPSHLKLLVGDLTPPLLIGELLWLLLGVPTDSSVIDGLVEPENYLLSGPASAQVRNEAAARETLRTLEKRAGERWARWRESNGV